MSDDTQPYTETDLVDTFIELVEAVSAYTAVFDIRGAKPEVIAQMHKEALAQLMEVNTRAEDIVAWVSAEQDDEIDDAALDDALGLDDEDGEWDDEDEDEDDLDDEDDLGDEE